MIFFLCYGKIFLSFEIIFLFDRLLSVFRLQAFQNSVSIAMCNRVGIEGSMAFSGESIVSGYNGNILALADDTEQLIVTDIDMSGAAKAREENPYTSLRRPDFYE